jgi:PAS domain S-box-containing protein
MSGKRIFNNTYQNIRLRIEADNREVALELMHQKQLLHTQQTPLAVIEFDLQLHVTDWNKAAENIFGYKKSEAIGNNILNLIVPQSSMNQVEGLWNGVLGLEPVVGDAVETHTKDGSTIVCEWYITPLTKRNKEIVGIAAMALDVTDKKRFEEELVAARDESDRANQAKSDFLSNMSHELRTPLNAILGFTQLLKIKTSLDDKQNAYINEIDSAGQHQLELVNQILDLSSIEEGHLKLSIEKVAVSDVIHECKTLISPLAEKNCISIYSEDVDDAYVKADYIRMKQVLLNLLSNAIKYNNVNGSVYVNCCRNNDRLRINVVDTGKGVPEKHQNDIFSPFNRLGAGKTVEGTGIGLSISKQLIEKMGGSIGVTSNEKSGSTFWVELDSCEADNIDENVISDLISINQHSSRIEYSGEKGIKILVAEDNPINQTLILSQLDSLGYKADLVSNGNEALSMLNREHYDLLFTDCNMPEMDGYELARAIRDNGNMELSIYAITADAFPEKESQCLAAGMNARITKPVSLDTLNQVINGQFG